MISWQERRCDSNTLGELLSTTPRKCTFVDEDVRDDAGSLPLDGRGAAKSNANSTKPPWSPRYLLKVKKASGKN
jgi:hypothetical protein